MPKFNPAYGFTVTGQLAMEERKYIYKLVRNKKVKYCLEVGTWNGGGSTYCIAHALRDNGAGVLHSFEFLEDKFKVARGLYNGELAYLSGYVKLHHQDATTWEPKKQVDFAFFDGNDSLKDIMHFDMYIRVGSHVLFHDWTDIKCKGVGEYLSGKYELINNPVWSDFGLGHFKKIG